MPAAGRPRRVWLVGSMGAGKTAVGRALSDRLGWPLLDNDEVLAADTGRTAVELADEGARTLHDAESAELRRLASSGPLPAVVGVAASVGDRPDDLALLRRTGTVVYLRASVDTLVRRVGPGTGRPWLEGDAATFLRARLDERGPGYERTADVVVDVDRLSPEEAADQIVVQSRDSLM